MKNKQMKKMTAVSCIMLALIMVLSMLPATSAFAASSHQYEIYQIFTGSVGEDNAIGDLVWGYSGINDKTAVEVGKSVPDAVLKDLGTLTDKSTDLEKLKVIKKYADLEKPLPKANYTLLEEGSAWVFTGLKPGYYLVKDKATTQTGIENGFYTLYVVEVTTGTLTVRPKGSIPSVDKVIVDDGERTVNEASIGEDVSYRITATVPKDIDYYKEYYLQFYDTLSKGLTFKADSVKVYFQSEDGSDKLEVTNYFHASSSTDSTTGVTTIKVTISDLLALKNLGEKYTFKGAESAIILEYNATLNDKAVINGANPNEVYLIYSNDPNNSGDGTTGTPTTYDPKNPGDEPKAPSTTGKTVKDEVETYTTEMTVKKVDESYNALTGAAFTLTGTNMKIVITCQYIYTEDTDGTYYKLANGTYTTTAPTDDTKVLYADEKTYSVSETTTTKGVGQTDTNVTAEVGADGYVTFRGLGAGTYKLTETTTPKGYNTADPIEFKINFNETTKTFSSTDSDADEEGISITVINKTGSTLPQTGGIGTTIFYVVGSILVLGAVVILITKKRMRSENE